MLVTLLGTVKADLSGFLCFFFPYKYLKLGEGVMHIHFPKRLTVLASVGGPVRCLYFQFLFF